MPALASTTDPSAANADDLGQGFLVLTVVLTALSASTTAVRLWVRGSKRQLGSDDLLIGVTALLAIVRMGVQIWGVDSGFGEHKRFLSDEQYIHVSLHLWITQIILFFMVTLMKSSICLLMLRIDSNRVLKYILTFLMAGLVATSGACVIILLAECRPINAWWDRKAGTCWPVHIRVNAILAQVGMSLLFFLVVGGLRPPITSGNMQVIRR